MTTDSTFRLSSGTVQAAAERLAEVSLSRDEATLIRWLLLKTRGALPGQALTIDSEDCRGFVATYFGVEGHPGLPFFSPFGGRGQSAWKAGGTTNWAVQTIYTQFQRLNQTEQRLYQPPIRIQPAAGELVKWQITLVTEPDYSQGLERLMGKRRVPLVDFAIWRYRDEEFAANEADTGALCRKLISELQLLEAELYAVFSGGEPYLDACVDAAPSSSVTP
jgi:hypothetical protein